MNHSQILKRAWHILWNYRVLWIFGIILSFTTPRSNPNDQINYTADQRDFTRWNLPADIQSAFDEINGLFSKGLSQETIRTIIIVSITVFTILLLLAVLFTILRYISETALIRMVDRYEENGEKVGFRAGFRLGWSQAAWRLFLVNLVVFFPVFLVFLIMFGCAAMPVITTALSRDVPTVPGIIATIGLGFLVIFLAILVGMLLSLVMETVYRVVVLQGTGVFEGISQGWNLVRSNFKDVGLMWLILVGIRIGFAVVIIPLVFLLMFLGAIVGGGIGVGVYYLVQAFAGNVASLVSALTIGSSFFFLVVGLPLAFVGGLFETYISTTWTLTYRALTQPALPVETGNGDELATEAA